jgi:hypothetical protein
MMLECLNGDLISQFSLAKFYDFRLAGMRELDVEW